jgi:biopolymer transport protein ExbB/TolQ
LRRRTITVAFSAASVLIILLLLQDLRGAGLAADRLKRIQELEAREAQLYEQLAQKDAQRESQRRTYIDRIRKGEAQLRDNAVEITALRARPEVNSTILALPPTFRD